MSRKITCSGGRVPVVQLALEKKVCARTQGPVLGTPTSIAAFVTEHYGCRPVEVALSFNFNTRSELLSVTEVSTGGIAHTQVDPKVVFGGALLAGATAVVIVHNHPSGDPEPSQLDMELTRQLSIAGRTLTIRVLDHIIVSRGGKYVSLLERGQMLGDVDPEDALGDEDPPLYAPSVPRRRPVVE